MKTKEEILDELVSERSSCDSFPEFIKCATIGAIENLVNDAMNVFAAEVAEEALKNAAENSTVTAIQRDGFCDYIADKESILNENNIPKL
jgi:hypothetical protein